MKVLLTGANGFVGSRILADLRQQALPTAVLLRPSSRRDLILEHLPHAEVRLGTVEDLPSLGAALHDVTHVVHCAGKTKVVQPQEYHTVNALGTRNLVLALKARPGQVQRLVHISSLAAGRPALAEAPAREDESPAPVSEYGRSKLAGEREIREGCPCDYVILRPPAVYGPGDSDFLQLFRAVRWHVRPCFGGGRQPLSLVYADDLAAAVITCLSHPRAVGRTYHVAHPEVTAAGALAAVIARQMRVWSVALRLPTSLLGAICVLQEAVARWTGRPGILNRERYHELRAPGWVCDTTRLREELGFVCPTSLETGVARTLAWYRQQRWL